MVIEMQSFTSSDQVYHITTSDRGEAVACDCKSYVYGYQRTPGRFSCKHMIRHNEQVAKENEASRSRYHFAQYDIA